MTPALADVIARAIMRERDTITRTLQAVGVHEADAEDIAQGVVLVAFAAAQDGRLAWDRRPTLQRWLYVVAYRHALAYLQRAARRELVTADPEDVRLVPSCEDRYVAIETLAMLRASTTPKRWRAASSLARGVPIGEVARRAGLTVPGAYNLIRLAREDFRAALARDAATTPLRRK